MSTHLDEVEVESKNKSQNVGFFGQKCELLTLLTFWDTILPPYALSFGLFHVRRCSGFSVRPFQIDDHDIRKSDCQRRMR